jgi:hypothetical protein
MNPKRRIRKIQMAEKTMDVFEPWKKAKIGFGVEPTCLDGVLFFPCIEDPISANPVTACESKEFILIYYIYSI